jgi:hypothetical protein
MVSGFALRVLKGKTQHGALPLRLSNPFSLTQLKEMGNNNGSRVASKAQ